MKKPTLEKGTVTGGSRRLLHYGLALAIALFAATSPTAASTDAASARARTMVESMVGKILVELAKEGIADEVKIKSLEAIVFTEFDFKSISRLVLARNSLTNSSVNLPSCSKSIFLAAMARGSFAMPTKMWSLRTPESKRGGTSPS
jgi:hypothetical protein